MAYIPAINVEASVVEKPGYKTTEFWLSSVAMFLGTLMASGVFDTLPADSWIAKLVGGVVVALSGLGYTASRARAKSGLREVLKTDA